jgi:tetratricopeptide (TPR) repeat protein
MAPNTIAPQAPDELPKDAFATLLGKGAGVPEFLKEPAATTTGVSEPPTVRVPEHPTDMPPVSDLAEAMVTEAKVTEAKVTEAKSGEVRAAGATPISGAADAANLSSDGSNESTGASASAESLAISEPLANAIPGVVTGRLDHSRPRRSKSQASTPDVNPGSPSKPRAQTDAARSVAQAAEAARPDSPTRPPSRPHRAQVQPATGAKFPWAAILLGILVLGGGVYAGIKIVGMKLDGTRRVPTPAVAEPTLATGPSPSGTTGATANAFTAVDEALEAGDIELAKAQLGDVPSEERASHDYRRLEILIEAMQIDLLWWQVRLAGGSEPSPADITADRVQARLGDLEAKLSSCRASKECKSATQPAYWALWRMRGQVELAERPTQGTVDANGLYQLAMLDWGKAGKVEPKILEKLRKARLAGVEQGPRVTALIVALIDLGRFDDARAELANLASAPKAHPHLAALNRYLRAKENSVDAGALDAGVLDGESSHGGRDGDNGDLDLALNEPDFRVRLQRAVQSLSRNELTKAQKLLRSVLAERPNDTEAITAMGDVHLRRGDLGQARTAYERALALNGSYLPAMAGAADVRWRSGDRANAVALYRRIVDRVGEGPGYGQTAASRIKEHEGVKAPEGAGEPARPTGDAPRNGQ